MSIFDNRGQVQEEQKANKYPVGYLVLWLVVGLFMYGLYSANTPPVPKGNPYAGNPSAPYGSQLSGKDREKYEQKQNLSQSAEQKFLTKEECHRHAAAYAVSTGKVMGLNFREIHPAPVLTTLVMKGVLQDGSVLLTCYDDNTFKVNVVKR